MPFKGQEYDTHSPLTSVVPEGQVGEAVEVEVVVTPPLRVILKELDEPLILL